MNILEWAHGHKNCAQMHIPKRADISSQCLRTIMDIGIRDHKV